MRIVITGTAGQVDTSLAILGEKQGFEIVRIGLPEVDLSRPETLEEPIRKANPDIIISSAAYTAVDKAEEEPELALQINGKAPGELARLATALSIPILHLSTDYVFAGDKDDIYDEDDVANPQSVYGHTKLEGERNIITNATNYVILRTSWVYSPYGNNFVKTMLRLGESRDKIDVVGDQRGCPTYAPEIARALLAIARAVTTDKSSGLRGIFNITGSGETNWAEFAQTIFEESAKRGGRSVTVRTISTAEYPTMARRPANSRMSSDRLERVYNLKLDPWRTSLAHCLDVLLGEKKL